MNIFKFISFKELAYHLAKKVLAYRFIYSNKKLTAQYLINKLDFVVDEDGYWHDKDSKDECKIWIKFDEGQYHGYYRLYYGANKTFIESNDTLEWFEMFYFISHKDRGRYDLITF